MKEIVQLLVCENRPNSHIDCINNRYKDSPGVPEKRMFLIMDAATGKAIGSSRFYDHDPEKKEIKIGYTFFSRTCWGKSINQHVKGLMIAHALSFVDNIIFHVGASNIRSQIAMERLGAVKIATEEVAYFGETSRLNHVYQISKP